MALSDNILNCLVVGVTGSGKSSLCNRMTKNNIFNSASGVSEGTTGVMTCVTCLKENGVNGEKLVRFIDTRGLGHIDNPMSEIEQALLIILDLKTAVTSIHCILLVIRNPRHTHEDLKLIQLFDQFIPRCPVLHVHQLAKWQDNFLRSPECKCEDGIHTNILHPHKYNNTIINCLRVNLPEICEDYPETPNVTSSISGLSTWILINAVYGFEFTTETNTNFLRRVLRQVNARLYNQFEGEWEILLNVGNQKVEKKETVNRLKGLMWAYGSNINSQIINSFSDWLVQQQENYHDP